jgi:hypothetical protein
MLLLLACGKTRTVHGRFATLYRPDGVATSAVNGLATNTIAPWIWVATDTGYIRHAVDVAPDGSFSTAGVPAGRYFLEVDTFPETPPAVFSLYQLSADEPDLTTVSAARPDVVFESNPTQMTLDVSNLTPWVFNPPMGRDWILVAGSQANVYSRPENSPGAGATIDHSVFDWNTTSTAAAIGLPDASKGDVEYVYQRSSVPIGSGATAGVLHYASRFSRVSDLTMRDGVDAALNLVLADAPQSGSLHVEMRGTQFGALAADVSPGATLQPGVGLEVVAIPHSLDYPDQQPGGAWSSLLYAQLPSAVDVDYGVVNYGRFLDAGWKEALWTFVITSADTEGDSYDAFEPFNSPEPGPIVPRLSPPKKPLINGNDAFASQSGVGLQPRFSWSAPSLGNATSYTVRIGGSPAVFARVYGTSFQVPPGFLQPGIPYVATITAVSAPWDALDSAPFRTGMPIYSAHCVTASFQP